MELLEAIIKRETRRLLSSKKARQYKVDGHVYELELELREDDDGKPYLEVQTWGFDYANIVIPTGLDYTELVRMKVHEQLLDSQGFHNDGVHQVSLRYYFNIMRSYAEACLKEAEDDWEKACR